MAPVGNRVVSEAMALPPDEKAKLADQLLASLEGPERAAVDTAWAEEAERRIDALRAGTLRATSGEQVIDELKARKK